MMTEIWWKAFLAAIITSIAAKVAGCKLGGFLLFSILFIGWAAALVILVAVSGRINSMRKKEKGE